MACSRVRIESNLFLGYKCSWPWMTHWNNSKTLYKHSYLLKLTTSMLSLFYTRFLMTRQKKYASHVCLSWMAQLTLLDVCTLLLVWISKFALGRLIYIIYELWYLGVARPQIENNCDVTTPMSGLWGYSSLLKQSLHECSPVWVWDYYTVKVGIVIWRIDWSVPAWLSTGLCHHHPIRNCSVPTGINAGDINPSEIVNLLSKSSVPLKYAREINSAQLWYYY